MSSIPPQDQAGVSRAKDLFISTFSHPPTIAVAAPGRVNLIGEHTDYNDGFVFPLALEKNTYIVASPSPDQSCHVVSELMTDQTPTFVPGDTPVEKDLAEWACYLKGMTALYERKGHKVIPFQAAIVTDVPLGGGLSSSASLEMATGVLIEQLATLKVSKEDRAKIGQACEHEFANTPCGIMDQLISSTGEKGKAVLIDCRSLEHTPVPLDNPEVVIVVANSNVKHKLSGSEYPERRAQCEAAANKMKQKFPDHNVTHLRDCNMEMLEAVKSEIDEDTYKRAKHAIEEDVRTLEAKKCLESGDLERCGQLMYESHASLRDLFQVSIPEIDALVEIAKSVDGVYGSRITGGGFGGCTVTLVKKSSVETLFRAVHEQYPPVSGGREASIFDTRAGSGARVLTDILST